MPVPNHFMVRFSGTLYNDASFSFGIRYQHAIDVNLDGSGDGGELNPADDAQKLEDWAAAIREMNGRLIFPLTIQRAMGGETRLTTIRCSRIGHDGKEAAVSVIEDTLLVAGSGTSIHPSQVAMAVTTLSGKPGASNRGRFYLPALGVAADQQGRINLGNFAEYAPAFGTFLYDLGNAGSDITNPQLVPVVVSTVKNTARKITSVRVGNRFDIQRRRADKQDEVYRVATVAKAEESGGGF